MKLLTAGTIVRVYMAVLLVLSTLFASYYQLGIALALLGIEVFSFYKQLKAGVNLVLTIALVVVAPLAFEALLGAYAYLLVIPAFLLVDEGLRSLALAQKVSFVKVGRGASGALRALCVGLVLVFGVAVLVWNFTLVFTVGLLLGYLAVMVLYILRTVPVRALQEDKSWSRVLVGDQETIKFNVKGKATAAVFVSLCSVDGWVDIAPANFTLKPKSEVGVSLKFTAPLAGPSKIRVQACFSDPRGLVCTGQVLEPLDLHIIPRAKYAAWLANKFLEQTSGGGMVLPVPSTSASVGKQGVEFFGCRSYHVGDRLKDIDWKHSYMLGELIVKEFSGSQGQVGVILANLSAESVKDADLLAYHLVMSALTFAMEGLPSGLAAYNSEGVVSVVQPMNPRETLKEALLLTEKIGIVGVKNRVLEAPVGNRLKRSVGQLCHVQSESAQRLGEFLMFELEAFEEAANVHPAALALDKIVEKINGSAVVTVVSAVDDDGGALSLVLERLRKKGYAMVFVRGANGA